MREIVILLLVVALCVLVIGAVNQDQHLDLDYVFGTWENVSVLSLSAVVAGSFVVLGLIIGAMARLRVVADRRKLERELQLVYPRLREAEKAAGLPAWTLPSEGAGSVGQSSGGGSQTAPPGLVAGTVPPVAPATAVAPPDLSHTVTAAPPEATAETASAPADTAAQPPATSDLPAEPAATPADQATEPPATPGNEA